MKQPQIIHLSVNYLLEDLGIESSTIHNRSSSKILKTTVKNI